MFLVQILLPLSDNAGRAFPDAILRSIQKELCDRFGGVTAYNRAPAEGIWQSSAGRVSDEIVVVDVMAETLDADWWAAFRKRLEAQLKQDELIIRAHEVRRL